MKNIIYLGLLMSLICLNLSCENAAEKTKPTAPKTKTVTKTTKTPKKANKNNVWSKLKKQVPLTDAEIGKLKAIDKKYQVRKKTLVKTKKWAGNANKANRTNFSKSKVQEQKKLLGAKYAKFNKVMVAHKKSAKKAKTKSGK